MYLTISNSMKTHYKIAVIGIGTAGITSLSHCLSWLNEDWKVYSIYDPETPILGIGESTTVAIPENLYLGTGFNMFTDSEKLNSTIKHGVKYTGWREHDIFSQIIPPSYGMHFDNFKLKEFSFERFKIKWGSKFQKLHRKITSLENQKDSVKVITDQDILEFDYVIDCRGYPEDYSNYYISDSIPVNHCLVNMIEKPGDWKWTYHVAHRNGWMFGIPLTSRQGWGYLYNDTITDRQDAVDDISERFKTSAQNLKLREFSFKNYYAKKFLDHRILKNGNRALFFEPMEAMSGFFYDQVMKHFFDFILENRSEDSINAELYRMASDLEAFIAYIYHGGSIYDSEFWRVTKEKSYNRLNQDFRFKDYVKKLRELTPSNISKSETFGIFSTHSWLDFDRQFGYNYITKKE